jgi:hypothetical protein
MGAEADGSWSLDSERSGFEKTSVGVNGRAIDFAWCQFIYVYPDADLVLVRHGNDCGGIYWTGLLGDIAQWLEPRLVE